MNARLYDPRIGRFFSPDNYITDPENPQNYNRYSYALNNPLSYVDPSGNSAYSPYNESFDGTACGFGDNVLDIMGGAYSEWADAALTGSIEDYIYGYSNYLAAVAHQNPGNKGGGSQSNSQNNTSNTANNTKEDNRSWFEKLVDGVKTVFNWIGSAIKEIEGYFNALILGVGDFLFNPDKFAVNAIFHYIYASDLPMYVDASHLNLGSVSQKDLKPTAVSGILTLDFFSIQNHQYAFSEQGIALGSIKLEKVSENEFKILDDTYNFEMHDWNKQAGRNVATIILYSFIMKLTYIVPNGEERRNYLLMKNAEMDRKHPSSPGLYGFEIHFYNNHVSIPKRLFTIEDANQW